MARELQDYWVEGEGEELLWIYNFQIEKIRSSAGAVADEIFQDRVRCQGQGLTSDNGCSRKAREFCGWGQATHKKQINSYG